MGIIHATQHSDRRVTKPRKRSCFKKKKEEVLRKHMIKTEKGIRSDVRNIICINSKGRQLRLTQGGNGS